MSELDKLFLKIEELRDDLNHLIKEAGDLKHPDVIIVSRKLDEVLNEYQLLLHKLVEFDDRNS